MSQSPPHPGSILCEDIIPAMEITITEAAKQLGVTRVALSRVINERAGISPEMAFKIEDWLRACPRYSGPRIQDSSLRYRLP
ncbi:MAG: HigA family addiction module antitoxin [Sedimenticola sp.]